MAKLGCIVLALTAACGATAQNIVSTYSADGVIKTATSSTQYIYSSVGGPRGSHNHAWVAFLKQSNSTSLAIPLDGSAGPISSVGTYYPPTYLGSGSASSSFTNSATQAVFSGYFKGALAFTTTLPAHAAASTSSGFSQYFNFTCANSSNVTINATGDPSLYIFMEDLSTGAYVFYGGATSNMVIPLQGGDNYMIHITAGASANANTQTGVTNNAGKKTFAVAYQFTLTPNNGDGGD